MARRLARGLMYGIGGYVVGAIAAYFLVLNFSPNTHDLELEAAMTSVFAYGPVVAAVAFIVGVFRAPPS